jgi:hypothetical protein
MAGGFEEMARATATATASTRCSRVKPLDGSTRRTRPNMDLKDECLAIWIDDAAESALVFDLRLP